MPRSASLSGGAVGAASMPPALRIRCIVQPERASYVSVSLPASFSLAKTQLILLCCRQTREVERVAAETRKHVR